MVSLLLVLVVDLCVCIGCRCVVLGWCGSV